MGQTSSQSDADKTTGSSHPALSRFKASALLYCISTVVIGFLVGSVLYGLGRLPLFIVNIASSVGAAIALISGILGASIEKSFPKGIWQNANRSFAIIAAILTVLLLTAFILVIPPSTSMHRVTTIMPTATIQPTPINTPNPPPTSTPTDTPTPIPTPTPTPDYSVREINDNDPGITYTGSCYYNHGLSSLLYNDDCGAVTNVNLAFLLLNDGSFQHEAERKCTD